MPTPYGGDFLVPEPDGMVTLVCRQPKEWVARKERTMTSSEHPGSAVLWGDALWEVLSVEPGHPGVRYRLAAWDECHVVRVRFVYDAGTEAARNRETLRHAYAARLRLLILAAAPLTGLLPGSVQSRWERDFGVPAVRLTILATVVPFIVGTLALMLWLVAVLGGGAVPGILLPTIWFLPESIVRFGLAMSQRIPVGSLPGVVFWFVWRGIAGRIGRA
jgi:hypothetical protein